MKRAGPDAHQADPSSSDSSSSDSEDEAPNAKKNLPDKAEVGRKKRKGLLDYGALSRHGYRGGLSVLRVPPPRAADEGKSDWSWSNGKRKEEEEESFEQRERTRAAANAAAEAAAAVAASQRAAAAAAATGGGGREKGGKSFSQKEKRKRDLGQASRGKSYVEEEKRLLRDSGVYSGFDS